MGKFEVTALEFYWGFSNFEQGTSATGEVGKLEEVLYFPTSPVVLVPESIFENSQTTSK
jgi:hypothetical protein